MSFLEIVGLVSTIVTALGTLLQLHPKTRATGKALTHAGGMSLDGVKRLKPKSPPVLPCLALALLGCAALPQNRAEFEEAVGQSCDATLIACKVYEALPEARNARDDLTCEHARRWCVDPAPDAAP